MCLAVMPAVGRNSSLGLCQLTQPGEEKGEPEFRCMKGAACRCPARSWVIVMMVGSGACHEVRCAHTKARSLDLIANPFIPTQEAVRIPRTTFGFPSVPR